MKHILIALLLVIGTTAAMAQTYHGTMSVGSYLQKNIEAQLTVNGDKATLFVRQVKFSRLMPVRVDVYFNDISVSRKDNDHNNIYLSGDGIVPSTSSKKWTKFTISDSQGYAGETCLFECMMAGKKVIYKGKKVKK
ncbi:MAG: hypothetical protein IJR13_00710 [Bacteroidales bacterium]|nr:hypothetical protein [Bacteroidales bacterium]